MVGTTEAAKLLEVTPRRVRDYLLGGRVHGAFKVGRAWVIPLINGLPVITEGKRVLRGMPKCFYQSRRN